MIIQNFRANWVFNIAHTGSSPEKHVVDFGHSGECTVLGDSKFHASQSYITLPQSPSSLINLYLFGVMTRADCS